MTACFELVIYHVTPGKEAIFRRIHAEIQSELAKLSGFQGFETATGLDNSHLHVDTVKWNDPSSAKAAYRAFASFPQAEIFMTCVDKVVFSGHFTHKK